MIIESYLEGKWVKGGGEGTVLFDATTDEVVGESKTSGLDIRAALSYGRKKVGPTLAKLTIHERAILLKKLALYLMEKKELLYEVSFRTGATRKDSWIDIEGGIGTLFAYSSKARKELSNQPFHIEGDLERISKNGTFVGQHICVPKKGIALHINAFNFPCWGLLEKFAPTFLAGVPSLIKPATVTCYLAEALVKLVVESGILPAGSLQLVSGSLGDGLDHLESQDVVTFTGSKSTGDTLRAHPKIISESIPFNMEADSLNCSILGLDANPKSAEFELFVKEVSKELSVKAGQKCTSIRRVIVPNAFIDDFKKAISKRLGSLAIGNPRSDNVRIGPLVGKDQLRDVQAAVNSLLRESSKIFESDLGALIDARESAGAFFSPTLLLCEDALKKEIVHSEEAFGPVTTIMGYESVEDSVVLANKGGGSLVASVFSADDRFVGDVVHGAAPYHGRFFLINSDSAAESTGHGSPLPHLVHGGPGRAGGGEELGGIRSVLHYMQRVALQGSPTTLGRVCNSWFRGGKVTTDGKHPFRKTFDELQIGEAIVSKPRTITIEDVDAFASLSGDTFYAHTDPEAAKKSLFGDLVAHGYFIISAAAGLFVEPNPGPVLANYGLENLRFLKPVYFNDQIKVQLTCKAKSPKAGEANGIVTWDAEVRNQHEELVATYLVLTVVERKLKEG